MGELERAQRAPARGDGHARRVAEVALPADGRRRVVVTGVRPHADGAALKRCTGDRLTLHVDLVCDGHDRLAGVVRARRPTSEGWTDHVLLSEGNDTYRAELVLDTLGDWQLDVEAWVDAFASWRAGITRKAAVDEVEDVDLAVGAALIREAATRANDEDDARTLRDAADVIAERSAHPSERVPAALADGLAELVARYPDRAHSTRASLATVMVEPVHARFASWYELFPRSTGEGTAHGTFGTAEAWLPYIASMGFDVVYLPPIHPIGRSFRKGPNNTPSAPEGAPGSPWAIGAPEGGHLSIHPDLGTLDDFARFVRAASDHGLRVALDIAFQVSPDHPWVREHPAWFRRRPDGTIQYAENPPKKYQDVYPFDFDTDDWENLWIALRDVFVFWLQQGVHVFRVDNPHTKPLRFWEWCIASIKARYPDATFLSEAFTRPKLKYALARAGFSQGYTYFTWRHTPHELRTYLEELTQSSVSEYFRPSLWPNTPDILPDDLVAGGRPAFLSRLVLAATLSSHYGIYGPAFELMERTPRAGSGEYLDNEKYEIKSWDRDLPHSLRPVITTLNGIRHAHPALQRNDTLRFHDTDNERLLCYSKRDDRDIILCVVNMDAHHRQSGWVSLDLNALDIRADETYQAHDLLGAGRYLFTGARNYVELDPHAMPAHVFAIRRHIRREHDFDYFM